MEFWTENQIQVEICNGEGGRGLRKQGMKGVGDVGG